MQSNTRNVFFFCHFEIKSFFSVTKSFLRRPLYSLDDAAFSLPQQERASSHSFCFVSFSVIPVMNSWVMSHSWLNPVLLSSPRKLAWHRLGHQMRLFKNWQQWVVSQSLVVIIPLALLSAFYRADPTPVEVIGRFIIHYQQKQIIHCIVCFTGSKLFLFCNSIIEQKWYELNDILHLAIK